MLKILDLFSGTQSVRKALELTGVEFDYIGVDIYTPEELEKIGRENLILDLAQPEIVARLLEKLPKGWKPDFIWASPLCTTFSTATCIPNGTLSYVKENGGIRIRRDNEYSHITHRNYVNYKDSPEWIKEQQRKGRLGLDLLESAKKIVNYFQVPFAIENPAYALSRYLMKEYHRNITTYCMYGFEYKKPTAIYSHWNIDLKMCNHKGQHKANMSGSSKRTPNAKGISGNKNRSRVPELLIVDIFNQLMKGGK